MPLLRYLLILCSAALYAFVLPSCNKNEISTDPDAVLALSADTLHFDTVFTSRGSVTRQVRIVNPGEKRLQVQVTAPTAGTVFFINVNGRQVSGAETVTLNSGDSAYIFVRATVDPNAADNPFLLEDSLKLSWNGNTSWLQLRAYGQNANYINSAVIAANTTWSGARPYVITRQVTIADGATLTIGPGTKIYTDATAFLRVEGTLRVNGTSSDRVLFTSSRLDETYKDIPGTWPGMVFTASSKNNLLQYTDILNAYQGVVCAGTGAANPVQLTLNAVRIHNIYDVGLYAINSSISAVNCEITQVGNEGLPGSGGSNVILAGGGSYSFDHCTMATYGNFYQNHKQPVVFATNSFNGSSAAMVADFTNSIIFGQSGFTESEIVSAVSGGASFSGKIQNCLYKAKTDPAGFTITNSILNTDPQFDTINTNLRRYNFRLKETSPCIDAALSGLIIDLDGNPRPVGTRPDIGAYEKQ